MGRERVGLRGWDRLRADEAIWPAQVATLLPLVSQVVALTVFFVTFAGGGINLRHDAGAVLSSLALLLLLPCLYGLAASWIGARESRGVWLAIALFGWSLAIDALTGRLLSLGAIYDVVALVLVVRAGRAIGVRYLAS